MNFLDLFVNPLFKKLGIEDEDLAFKMIEKNKWANHLIIDGKEYDFNLNDMKKVGEVYFQGTRNAEVNNYTHRVAKKLVTMQILPFHKQTQNLNHNVSKLRDFLNLLDIFNDVQYIVKLYGFTISVDRKKVGYKTIIDNCKLYLCMEHMDLTLIDFYLFIHDYKRDFPNDLLIYIALNVLNSLNDAYELICRMYSTINVFNIVLNSKGEVKLMMHYTPPHSNKTSSFDYSRLKKYLWSLGITMAEVICCGELPMEHLDQYLKIPPTISKNKYKELQMLSLTKGSIEKRDHENVVNCILNACTKRGASNETVKFIKEFLGHLSNDYYNRKDLKGCLEYYINKLKTYLNEKSFNKEILARFVSYWVIKQVCKIFNIL